MKNFAFIINVLIFSILLGCSSTQIVYMDQREIADLSDDWNDFDALIVAQEMVASCLAGHWLASFRADEGRQPIVVVGAVSNLSHEKINAAVFRKYLERELINSGKVVFAASSEDSSAVADAGRRRGADFIMSGSLSSVTDVSKRKSVNFYQANLELIDLTSNQKTWIGQKEIEKSVKKRGIYY